jgi:hypothetical protein
MTMPFFAQLGAEADRLWRERQYREPEFPEAAFRALESLPPSTRVTLEEILRWAIETDSLPSQHDLSQDFGQPPLTVYWGRDFRIEVLFWTIGIPGIHQHAFSGAFHVLCGASLHSVSRFSIRQRVTTRLLFGDLRPSTVEVLEAGSSRPILSGQEFIHSTFHLDRPSVTIVIRTNRDQDKLPQYTYLPPSIAYDPHEVPEAIRRRSQLFVMLVASERYDLLTQLFSIVCGTNDIVGVFFYVLQLCPLLGAANRRKLLALLRPRNEQLVIEISPVLALLDKRQHIQQVRKTIQDPQLQFFLAALLNIQDKDLIVATVRARFPMSDPVSLIVDWTRTLLAQSVSFKQVSPNWLDILEGELRATAHSSGVGLSRPAPRSVSHPLGYAELQTNIGEMRDHWFFGGLL